MRRPFYKYRIHSVGGKFAVSRLTNNEVPQPIIEYLFSVVCNIMQASSYCLMMRYCIPYKNSNFICIIRHCDSLNEYTIDITEITY